MGPMFGLDGCRKFRPHRDSIPGPSIQWRVAIPAHGVSYANIYSSPCLGDRLRGSPSLLSDVYRVCGRVKTESEAHHSHPYRRRLCALVLNQA